MGGLLGLVIGTGIGSYNRILYGNDVGKFEVTPMGYSLG